MPVAGSGVRGPRLHACWGGVSDHGEPVHQQFHPALGVLRREPSRPGQGGQSVQGRPERLGEQCRVDAVPGDLAEVLQQGGEGVLQRLGVSSCANARPPSSWNMAS